MPYIDLETKRANARAWYWAHRERVLAERAAPEARQRKNELRRARYAADPEAAHRATAASAKYRLLNPERARANGLRYTQSAKGRTAKRAALLRSFGLTSEAYDDLLLKQGGVCAICRQPETRQHRGSGPIVSLAIDHDHACCPDKGSCGACIRGLLCDRCNLGRWPDDPALLRAAADYFEAHR